MLPNPLCLSPVATTKSTMAGHWSPSVSPGVGPGRSTNTSSRRSVPEQVGAALSFPVWRTQFCKANFSGSVSEANKGKAGEEAKEPSPPSAARQSNPADRRTMRRRRRHHHHFRVRNHLKTKSRAKAPKSHSCHPPQAQCPPRSHPARQQKRRQLAATSFSLAAQNSVPRSKCPHVCLSQNRQP